MMGAVSELQELRAWCVALRESNTASAVRWYAEEEPERAEAYEIHAAALRTVVDKIDVMVAERMINR